MLTAVNSTALPATSRSRNAIDDLWEQRASIVVRNREASAAFDQARKRMPAWALPGPQYINAKGEKCGPIVGWPEVEDVAAVGLPQHADAFRYIRPSPHQTIRDFKTVLQFDLRNPKRRAALKERYREKLAVIKKRLDQRDFEEEKWGLLAAEGQLDVHSDALCEIEKAILALNDNSPAWLTAISIIEIGREIAYDDVGTEEPSVEFHIKVLQASSRGLKGRLAADAHSILSGLTLRQVGCFG